MRDLSFNSGSNLENTGCQEAMALAKYVFAFLFPVKKINIMRFKNNLDLGGKKRRRNVE